MRYLLSIVKVLSVSCLTIGCLFIATLSAIALGLQLTGDRPLRTSDAVLWTSLLGYSLFILGTIIFYEHLKERERHNRETELLDALVNSASKLPSTDWPMLFHPVLKGMRASGADPKFLVQRVPRPMLEASIRHADFLAPEGDPGYDLRLPALIALPPTSPPRPTPPPA